MRFDLIDLLDIVVRGLKETNDKTFFIHYWNDKKSWQWNNYCIQFDIQCFLYILTQSRKSGMIVYGGTFKTFRNNS